MAVTVHDLAATRRVLETFRRESVDDFERWRRLTNAIETVNDICDDYEVTTGQEVGKKLMAVG